MIFEGYFPSVRIVISNKVNIIMQTARPKSTRKNLLIKDIGLCIMFGLFFQFEMILIAMYLSQFIFNTFISQGKIKLEQG